MDWLLGARFSRATPIVEACTAPRQPVCGQIAVWAPQTRQTAFDKPAPLADRSFPMWFDPASDDSLWSGAARHLCKADPLLAAVIRRVGPCQMSPRRDYFVALCRAIFAQQLNVRVAQVLFDR